MIHFSTCIDAELTLFYIAGLQKKLGGHLYIRMCMMDQWVIKQTLNSYKNLK